MTNKINIKRAKCPPTIDWISCGEDWGYNLFANEKPRAIALRIINEVFGNTDLSNMKFVYLPRYYRGSQCCQDSIEVYYKNNF